MTRVGLQFPPRYRVTLRGGRHWWDDYAKYRARRTALLHLATPSENRRPFTKHRRRRRILVPFSDSPPNCHSSSGQIRPDRARRTLLLLLRRAGPLSSSTLRALLDLRFSRDAGSRRVGRARLSRNLHLRDRGSPLRPPYRGQTPSGERNDNEPSCSRRLFAIARVIRAHVDYPGSSSLYALDAQRRAPAGEGKRDKRLIIGHRVRSQFVGRWLYRSFLIGRSASASE